MPLRPKKIFISSTAIDLPEYRETAIYACQRLGFVPLCMERFPPDPRKAVDACLHWVDEADVYLGIYAHRYGYVPDGAEISLTEMEYLRARERDLPVLLFVVDPEHPWRPGQIETGPGAQRLERFKEAIESTHTCRKFRDVQTFKEDLLIYLPGEAAAREPEVTDRKPDRALPPKPPVLHSVPPYVSSMPFLGRREELETLLPSALENRARQLIPGVRRYPLGGLAPGDSVALLKRLGVTGARAAIEKFLDQFDHHSLLIGALAGRIRDYRPAPGNFDRWLADPQGGGSLHLKDLDLRQRRTHILHYALLGLSEDARRLLSRIAVLSDAVDYATLEVVNPSPPPIHPPVFLAPPPPVGLPFAPLPFAAWAETFDKGRRVSSPLELPLVDLEDPLAGLEHEFFDTPFAAVPKPREEESAAEDEAEIEIDLYDAFVLELEDDEAPSSLVQPPPDMLGVEPRLPAWAQGPGEERLQRYNAYVAEKLARHEAAFAEERARYKAELAEARQLSQPLLVSVAAYPTVVEFLRPLFVHGLGQPPALRSAWDRGNVPMDLGFALSFMGQLREALELDRTAMQIHLEAGDWEKLGRSIYNYSSDCWYLNRLAHASSALDLALELATATGNREGYAIGKLLQLGTRIAMGEWEEALSIGRELADFTNLLNSVRPGALSCSLCWLAFHRGTVPPDDLEAAYTVALLGKNLDMQMQIQELRAEVPLRAGDASLALELALKTILLAKKSGIPAGRYQGCLARALAQTGYPEDARSTLEEALETSSQDVRDHCYCDAAEVFLFLGDLENARSFAQLAYRQAWADGPPFLWRWALDRCLKVFDELGMVAPELPPFDPGRREPLPFEEEIRAAIAARQRPGHSSISAGTSAAPAR